jgi:flagellar protein FlaG
MSISTGAMVTGVGLQAAGAKGQGSVLKPADAAVKTGLNTVPAAKTLADARDAELDKPSAKQVQQSLEDINKVMAGFSISVQFQIDPDYKELIVKVVDQDTGKLIRQIPTEEVVKMSKAMDNLKGLLFAQSV